MNPKVNVAVLVLACLGLGFAAGWVSQAPSPDPPTYLARLTEDLALRSDQITAVDSLLSELDRALEDLIVGHREAMRDEVAERLERSEKALMDVLDEEQRERFQDLVRAEND